MLVPWAAPRTQRQRMQWQLCMNIGSPVASKATAPHRQLPSVIPGRGATFGRGCPFAPYCGGYSSYCGRVSVIVYHGALEPTNMCPWGLMPRSPSSGPAGRTASEWAGMVIGKVEPQVAQLVRDLCCEDLYSSWLSLPAVQRNLSSGADT